MTEEVQTSGSIRSVRLSGEDESRYTKRFLATIRAARLNNQFPDGRRLSAQVRAMDPDVHRGLYEGLQINVDSGLPTYREWTRVQTDVSIAADQLHQLGNRGELARRAAESEHAIHSEQLKKYDYYDDIADTRLASLGEMDVALRRLDAANNEAHFFVTFDKLDVSGIFVRYRIALAQRASVWGDQAVKLDEDTALYTEEFKSLIYKFSSLDAEFTYTKLTTLSGVTVQRISRGTVGPIYYGGMEAPEPFDELLGDDPTKFVALFGMDTAADDIAENRNNDPFGGLFESELARKMRPTYARARETFGYKVYKDRKFVVSRGIEGPLREMCDEMNTSNIIYSI